MLVKRFLSLVFKAHHVRGTIILDLDLGVLDLIVIDILLDIVAVVAIVI